MPLAKPDKAGINSLMGVIKRAPSKEVIMGAFSEPVPGKDHNACGTAYCIAGWASVILPGKAREDGYVGALRSLLGVRRNTKLDDEVAALWMGGGIGLERFDRLSAIARKRAVLGVLAHFRDTGKVDWQRFTPSSVWS